MRKITRIFVHCTASEWGNVEEIRRWHKQRGWLDIGYHWVILNPFPQYGNYKDCIGDPTTDGLIQPGRPEHVIGSHVATANADSLGVALVGNEAFSQRQVDSLVSLCVRKCREYQIHPQRIRGHSEYWTDQGLPPHKSCPNLPVEEIRNLVTRKLALVEADQVDYLPNSA